MDEQKIRKMTLAAVLPAYVAKAERKGRSAAEVEAVVCWLTGYHPADLTRVVEAKADFEKFFAEAPAIAPQASQIKGVICGYRIEAIEDPVVRLVRCLDKLVDELAKGRPLSKVLRS